VLVPERALERIVAIGEARRPREACGLVLGDGRVFELPNRSDEPASSYQTDVDDLEALDLVEGDLRDGWAIWHTHPSGNVGPSSGDLKNRLDGVRYLVVAIPSGEAAQY
jgi:proteasome lid subunit RPN8/RPN11